MQAFSTEHEGLLKKAGNKNGAWRLIGGAGGLILCIALVVVVSTHTQSSGATQNSPMAKAWLATSTASSVMLRMDIVEESMDVTWEPSARVMKAMSSVVRTDSQGSTTRWVRIPGGLKHVSMARNGAIWGVNSADQIFHSRGYFCDKFLGWHNVAGGLMQVSVGGDAGEYVIGVNSGYHIFQRHGITLGATAGTTWTQIPGGLMDVSTDKTATWGVNTGHQIFERTGTSSWHMKAGALVQINVGGAHVVGVNSNDNIFERLGSGWKQLPGAAICASQAEDGEMWVTSKDHSIWRWHGSGWTRIAGALMQIHVASATQIIGVAADHSIWIRA